VAVTAAGWPAAVTGMVATTAFVAVSMTEAV
jgi:hypothetical protein